MLDVNVINFVSGICEMRKCLSTNVPDLQYTTRRGGWDVYIVSDTKDSTPSTKSLKDFHIISDTTDLTPPTQSLQTNQISTQSSLRASAGLVTSIVVPAIAVLVASTITGIIIHRKRTHQLGTCRSPTVSLNVAYGVVIKNDEITQISHSLSGNEYYECVPDELVTAHYERLHTSTQT